MKKQLILGLGLVLVLSGCGMFGQDQNQQENNVLSPEDAQTKAKEFIDENLLASGQSGSQVTEVTEENGLYKMKVQVEGQSIDSYMTKDGKKFFPQVIDMEDPEQGSAGDQAQQPQQPQQQEMSNEERAEAMVEQGNMLLDQAGEDAEEGTMEELEQKIEELDEIVSSEEPDSEELTTKMQELQQAATPLIEDMQGAQSATGTQPAPQPQPQPQPAPQQ